MNAYLIQFISLLGTVLYIAILGRVIISWLNLSSENPIVVILYQVTEPILGPIRKFLPRMGMLDLSPIVAILLIGLIQRGLTSLVASAG